MNYLSGKVRNIDEANKQVQVSWLFSRGIDRAFKPWDSISNCQWLDVERLALDDSGVIEIRLTNRGFLTKQSECGEIVTSCKVNVFFRSVSLNIVGVTVHITVICSCRVDSRFQNVI